MDLFAALGLTKPDQISTPGALPAKNDASLTRASGFARQLSDASAATAGAGTTSLFVHAQPNPQQPANSVHVDGKGLPSAQSPGKTSVEASEIATSEPIYVAQNGPQNESQTVVMPSTSLERPVAQSVVPSQTNTNLAAKPAIPVMPEANGISVRGTESPQQAINQSAVGSQAPEASRAAIPQPGHETIRDTPNHPHLAVRSERSIAEGNRIESGNNAVQIRIGLTAADAQMPRPNSGGEAQGQNSHNSERGQLLRATQPEQVQLKGVSELSSKAEAAKQSSETVTFVKAPKAEAHPLAAKPQTLATTLQGLREVARGQESTNPQTLATTLQGLREVARGQESAMPQVGSVKPNELQPVASGDGKERHFFKGDGVEAVANWRNQASKASVLEQSNSALEVRRDSVPVVNTTATRQGASLPLAQTLRLSVEKPSSARGTTKIEPPISNVFSMAETLRADRLEVSQTPSVTQLSGVRVENLQEQILKVLMERRVSEGRLEIKLAPARLGTLQISMQQSEQGELQIAMLAREASTREMLEHHIPRLRSALQDAGIQLGDVQIRQESKERQEQQADRGRHAFNSVDNPTLADEQAEAREVPRAADGTIRIYV